MLCTVAAVLLSLQWRWNVLLEFDFTREVLNPRVRRLMRISTASTFYPARSRMDEVQRTGLLNRHVVVNLQQSPIVLDFQLALTNDSCCAAPHNAPFCITNLPLRASRCCGMSPYRDIIAGFRDIVEHH